MSVRDLFVGIDVDVDDTPLRALESIVADLNERFNNLDSGGLDDIERDARSAADEFDDLVREVDAASRSINRLDATELDRLQAELLAISANVAILEDRIEELVQDERTAAISTSLLGNSFVATGLKGIAMSAGISGGIGLITSVLAPLIVLVGGLGASLLAAGAGIAAFGAVAMEALGPVIEGAENLTAAQAKARTEFESFSEFWRGFAKQFETPVLEMFGTGLKLVKNILDGLAPTILNVANVFNTLVQEMDNSVVAGGLQDFFGWLESNAAETIYNFAHILGNTLSGLWKVFGAFSPIGAAFEESLLSMTERFDEWASNLASSSGFQKFIDYALTNGPALMNILGDIFSIASDVIVALAPLGTVVLSGLGLLTNFISSEVSPRLIELSDWIRQLASVFLEYLIPSITPLVQQWLPTLSGVLDTIKNLGITLVETFIGIFPTLQNIVQTVLPVVITLFQNVYGIISSLINNVVIPLLPMLGSAISAVWGVIKPILEPLKNLLSTIGSTIMFLINEVVSPLIPIIGTVMSAMWKIVKPILDGIVTVFGNIIDSVSSTVAAVKDLVSALLNFKMPKWVSTVGSAVSGAIGNLFDGSHATGLGRVPFDGYVAELHKDEAVLTADQSNILRDLGVLKGDGSNPELDLSGNDNGSSSSGSTYNTTHNTNAPSNTVHAPVNIIVQGGSTSDETVLNIREAMEEFFADLTATMPQVREG